MGPEVLEALAEVWTKVCPARITLAVRSRFSSCIGRRRALRRRWSVSSGLFALASVCRRPPGAAHPVREARPSFPMVSRSMTGMRRGRRTRGRCHFSHMNALIDAASRRTDLVSVSRPDRLGCASGDREDELIPSVSYMSVIFPQ
jgi:hypothetical protein